EGLFLEQGVTEAAQVRAEFEGVVTHDFRPGIAEIDVRLGANPRKACRVSEQRVGEAAVDLNADEAAGDVIAQVYAGNADVGGSGRTEIGLMGFIVIPACAYAKFRDESV